MHINSDFARAKSRLASEWGILFAEDSVDFLRPEFRRDFQIALDAQPTLQTTPNAGPLFWLTSYIDPEQVRILQTPNVGATILGEEKQGDWISQTIFIAKVENTGDVASYGDYDTQGRSDVNQDWEERQAYNFQTHYGLGDMEVERAGAGKLNLVSEKQISSAKTLDKFLDFTYHFGIAGMQNYGLLNDPGLPAALTPATKTAGGPKWVTTGGAINATAQEIYADFQALIGQLFSVSGGRIKSTDSFKLVYPNTVAIAFSAVNSFGITITNFIKQSFPNVEFIVAPRYATASGNVVQLWATEFDGIKVGTCAFNHKLKDYNVVRGHSSYSQKRSSGTWGAIIKYPVACAQMLGV